MAITASLMYGITRKKIEIDTLGQSLEAETHKGLLCTDAYAPNADTHDFRDDVTNEAPATGGYTTGGVTVTTTVLTVGAPAAGQWKFDHDDPQWAASTIVAVMAFVHYYNVGTAATDPLSHLLDFVTAATTNNGLLLIQIHADGAVNLDYLA